MNFSAPKKATWWLAVLVGGLGVFAKYKGLPVLGDFSFWLVAFAFVLLALATLLKNL